MKQRKAKKYVEEHRRRSGSGGSDRRHFVCRDCLAIVPSDNQKAKEITRWLMLPAFILVIALEVFFSGNQLYGLRLSIYPAIIFGVLTVVENMMQWRSDPASKCPQCGKKQSQDLPFAKEDSWPFIWLIIPMIVLVAILFIVSLWK